MYYACRYPREFKAEDIVQCPGFKVEILKTNIDRYDSDPERKWYRVKVIVKHDDNRIMDLPCNTLCYVSSEGNKRIYSKPIKCNTCHQIVRLYYPESTGMHGSWICPECGTEYPFMFYDIKSDKDYNPMRKVYTGTMQAEVGDKVIYVGHDGKSHGAVVTTMHTSYNADLVYDNGTGKQIATSVPFDSRACLSGTWRKSKEDQV